MVELRNMYAWILRPSLAVMAMAALQSGDTPRRVQPAEPTITASASSVSQPPGWQLIIMGIVAVGFACRVDPRKLTRFTL